MKKADKSAAEVALILGEQELVDGRVSIKFLRQQQAQQTILQADLVDQVRSTFESTLGKLND